MRWRILFLVGRRLASGICQTKHLTRFFVIFLIVTQTACGLRFLSESKPDVAVPTSGYHTVDKIPFREAWYGTYLNEEKIGYSHFKIEPSDQNFAITTDSLLRFTRLKQPTEVRMKERVVVRPDLSMVSFQSAVRQNGKDMTMTGRTDGEHILVDTAVEGEKVSREFPLHGKVYHANAIDLMPALLGLKEGQTYTFNVFDPDVFNPENQGTHKVDQQISTVKGPAGPNGAVWKVNNKVGEAQVNSWLNSKGLTVLYKGSSLISMLEDENSAKKFLEEKAPGKDLALDYSLIRISKPLPHPEKLRFLKARFQGIESSVIPQDHRQRITTPSGNSPKDSFDVTVSVEDPSRFKGRAQDPAGPSFKAELASTIKIQSDHKEIVDQAKKIVSPNDSPLVKVTKLTHWTAENIKSEIKDSFTALSVLHSKEGECKSHAFLYTALARSQHIPTRVVRGIVYSKEGGFLYHAWCESYLDGWLAVDPTMNQIPADATHIKIAAGDSDDSASAILKMVGKVKSEVLDYN
jgi:Transglutaminase-like superfamily